MEVVAVIVAAVIVVPIEELKLLFLLLCGRMPRHDSPALLLDNSNTIIFTI